MPDLLYGELDDERVERVRAQLAEDPELSSTLASYEALRATFRTLPDEDPPAAISAQLMHEAAKRVAAADAEASGRSIWERIGAWLAPLWAHPTLATVGSLAVLIGLGGFLYMRIGGQIAQPGYSPPSSAPTPGASAPGAGVAPALQRVPTEGAGEAADPPPVTGISELEDRETVRDDQAATGNQRGRTRGVPAVPRPRATPKRAGNASASSTTGVLGGGAVGEANRSDRLDRGPRNRARGARSKPASAKPGADSKLEQAPAPEPAEAEAADETATPATPDRPGRAAPAPAKSAPAAPQGAGETSSKVKSLHNRAAAAARRGECARVKTLGASIESLDGAYYREVFTRDSRVKACLAR